MAELVQAKSPHVAHMRCMEEISSLALDELKASQDKAAKAYEQAENKLHIAVQNIAVREAAHRERLKCEAQHVELERERAKVLEARIAVDQAQRGDAVIQRMREQQLRSDQETRAQIQRLTEQLRSAELEREASP